MATFVWNGRISAAWVDLGANTIIFGGATFGSNINVASYQDSTYAGNGDPGTSQGQMNNVKYLTNSTMSLNGAGSANITDANLAAVDCTLKVNFSHGSAVAVSSARLYSYDGSVVTNEAVGIAAYAFERGVSATAWTQINSDSGNIGGDNSGERLALADQSSNTSHDYYLAVSASPESVGAKASFDFGVNLTYS